MYSVLSQEILLPVIVTFLSVSVAHVFSNRTKNMVEKHKYSPALGSGLGDFPGCLRYLAIVHVLPTEDDGDDGRHAPMPPHKLVLIPTNALKYQSHTVTRLTD